MHFMCTFPTLGEVHAYLSLPQKKSSLLAYIISCKPCEACQLSLGVSSRTRSASVKNLREHDINQDCERTHLPQPLLCQRLLAG
jgi:sulfite reductase beta subunit-like hemoprotein